MNRRQFATHSLAAAGVALSPKSPDALAPRHPRSRNEDQSRLRSSLIEITESGCAYLDSPDEEQHGRVPDTRRIHWYRQTLAELARAMPTGAQVRAYHAWTLLDNSSGLRDTPNGTD